MLDFSQLTLVNNINAGKNKLLKGIYRDNITNEEYFIKKPDDPKELFTELFAGLLIETFKENNLIPKRYFPSLICASHIKIDNSYGLIQPKIDFKELFHYIGTGNSDNTDKNTFLESIFGTHYYNKILDQRNYLGLSVALLYSILLSAHSVHSGNIVILQNQDNDNANTQFARIDWGDAFRNLADPLNNENICYASENRGWFNYKSLTKNYVLNYAKVYGLFTEIGNKAEILKQRLDKDLLVKIVLSTIEKIPDDLINKGVQNELAGYLHIGLWTRTVLCRQATFFEFFSTAAKA